MQVDLSTIQAGTFLLAVATFLGALIGALTQFGLQRREKREARRNLRRALLAEISEADLEGLENHGLAKLKARLNSIPDSVYQSKLDEIGTLSEQEVESIVGFYSSVYQCVDAAEYLKRSMDENLSAEGEQEQYEEEREAYYEELRENTTEVANQVQDSKRQTIRVIKDNL